MLIPIINGLKHLFVFEQILRFNQNDNLNQPPKTFKSLSISRHDPDSYRDVTGLKDYQIF